MPRLQAEISARIPAELKDDLLAYARERDVSYGSVVRWAIEDFLGSPQDSGGADGSDQSEAPWITSFLTGPRGPSLETTTGEKT